jgi:hypothetical protein
MTEQIYMIFSLEKGKMYVYLSIHYFSIPFHSENEAGPCIPSSFAYEALTNFTEK